MGVQLYLSAGLVGLVWLVWIAINYHGRESMRMARWKRRAILTWSRKAIRRPSG